MKSVQMPTQSFARSLPNQCDLSWVMQCRMNAGHGAQSIVDFVASWADGEEVADYEGRSKRSIS